MELNAVPILIVNFLFVEIIFAFIAALLIHMTPDLFIQY